MEEHISNAVTATGFPPLKDFQVKVLREVLAGKDVFATAPSGYGKSGTYQIAPFAFSSVRGLDFSVEKACSIVLVVEPLISLMRDQVYDVRKRGIRAGMLSDRSDMTAIKEGRCSLVYGAPESYLTPTTRDLLLSSIYQTQVALLVVDESHCVKKLAENVSKSKARAFRKHYAKLGNLRALCPAGTPVLAFTATASKDTADVIKTRMVMDPCVTMKEPANKDNITYYFEKVAADHRVNFLWLLKELEKNGIATPRHLIFFSNSDVCAQVYRMFGKELGRNAYHAFDAKNTENNNDTNRLYAMYHAQVPDHIKETVHKSVAQEDGPVRVIFCTNAFGMGVDVKGGNTVRHYGPSKDAEEYLQETGRVARVQGILMFDLYSNNAVTVAHLIIK